MNQRANKSFEQIIEDLNRMFANFGRNKRGPQSPYNGGGGGNAPSGPNPFLQWIIISMFLIAYGALSSFYQVETTQKGVITRFGAFYDIADEGLHLKLPFGIDQVYKVEVTRIHEEQFGFRKDGRKLSAPQLAKESLMLTGDLKLAVVEWIVQYRIHDAKKFLFNAVGVSNNIRDISISVMRRVVGDKLVSDVLTVDRVSIAEAARRLTQETLDKFDMGVTITNLNLQNVNPPESVRAAFNEVNVARQEKDQLVNQAKGAYNQVIPEAGGRALKMVAEAEAYSINLVNKAKGDAEKFKTILEAYRKAPEITRRRLYLDTMEEIFSQVDHLTVVDPEIKGLMPIYSKNVAQALAEPVKAAEPKPTQAAQ